jgi:sodium-dependent dicarboxylate transporter 2/3/5
VFILTAGAGITRGLIWKDILPMVDDSMIAIASAFLLFLIPSKPSPSSPSSSLDKENLKDSPNFGHTPDSLRNPPSTEFQDSNKNKNRSKNNGNDKIPPRLLDWNTPSLYLAGLLFS